MHGLINSSLNFFLSRNILKKNRGQFCRSIFIVMAILPFLETFTRLIGILSIPASQILVQHLTLWIGFLGAAIATRQNKLLALTQKNIFQNEKMSILVDI